MKRFCIILFVLFPLISPIGAEAGGRPGKNLRLVYWNIQNGMWDGQPDNYGRFCSWVREQKPDVCVWCEAQPIYKTGTYDKLDDIELWRADSLLTVFWKGLAARYGHRYVFIGGHRDNYPQVITSRYPIEPMARILGNGADSIVTHGAGWARIRAGRETVNIVTLHTWPQKFKYGIPAADRKRSMEAKEGDFYRRMELEYICSHTLPESFAQAEKELWMMMGDFNSRSRADNWVYGLDEDDPAFLVHDYITSGTPYIDAVHEKNPDNFYSSIFGRSRIDFLYCTPALFDRIKDIRIISDNYTTPRRSTVIRSFCEPSDHRPIIADFSL